MVVKETFKKIQYLTRLPLQKVFARKKSKEYVTDPQDDFLLRRLWFYITGWLLNRLRTIKWWYKRSRYIAEQRLSQYTIFLEFIRLSKEILFGLLIVGLFCFACEYIFYAYSAEILNFSFIKYITSSLVFLTFPSRDFITLFLEVSVGAISAILGLLFALYAVGFQMSTDKYSSDVSEYINEEMVSNFFFKLLIFTDVFGILLLIRNELIKIIDPVFSFGIFVIFVITSLLGTFVFKDHYILALKPLAIFRRLFGEMKKEISFASNRSSIYYKDGSLIQAASIKTQKSIKLIHAFFKDLVRNGNWNDAMHTPIVLGYITLHYSQRKKYLDQSNGYWFVPKEFQVKSQDCYLKSISRHFKDQK